MLHSTHYNLNLAEGTDLVNPLTVDVPNYQTIDSTMYANEQSGVGSATELKTGTIHAITRTAPARSVFKFTSTSVFNLGDTFTVDGNVVTALYPDQSSLKNRCFIVGSEVLCLLTGSQLTVLATYLPNANEVPYDDDNSSFTADDVQEAIEKVDAKTNVTTVSYTSTTTNAGLFNVSAVSPDKIINVFADAGESYYFLIRQQSTPGRTTLLVLDASLQPVTNTSLTVNITRFVN